MLASFGTRSTSVAGIQRIYPENGQIRSIPYTGYHDRSPLARCHPPSGACRPPGTPWTKRNRGLRLCLHADTTRQCWTRRASHPARSGSSLQTNAVCGLHGGCSSRSAQTTIQGARISVSSPLLDGYDEPEISVPQAAKSVSQALMSDIVG